MSHSTCYGLIIIIAMQGQGLGLYSGYFRYVLDRSGSTSRVSTEFPGICGGNVGGSQRGKI